MSLGYASLLSERDDLGGELGSTEFCDDRNDAERKIAVLADWVRQSKDVVFFTGAGISTSCGIPDFRGPKGVWTLKKQKKAVPALSTPFCFARPSLTHQAILGLFLAGKVRYVISQNVDSLHLRSGIPREKMAEIHGNAFAERCRKCKHEYYCDFELNSVGFKPTGRKCTMPECGGDLHDNLLDWEDALPSKEFQLSMKHASATGVILCLGSSLRIVPAANIPDNTLKAGGKMVIVNLQETPKDEDASMVLHTKVDVVMALLMKHLGLKIPPYIRQDKVLISHDASWVQQQPLSVRPVNLGERQLSQDKQGPVESTASWTFTLRVASWREKTLPMPMVSSAKVRLLGLADWPAPLEMKPGPPFQVEVGPVPAHVHEVECEVQLTLMDAADPDKRHPMVRYSISQPGGGSDALGTKAPRTEADAPPPNKIRRSTRIFQRRQLQEGTEFSFISQEVHYDPEAVLKEWKESSERPISPKAPGVKSPSRAAHSPKVSSPQRPSPFRRLTARRSGGD